MASVRQGATVEEDQAGSSGAPSALRIDTDVFAALSETDDADRADQPTLLDWFDCWRP